MRLAPIRKLFIITALCLAGCEGGDNASSRSASFEVHLENTGAQTQTAGHHGIGIPFMQGQFDEVPSFSIEAENQQFYSADHEVMARWPDGSVRWAWFDFWAPRVAAGGEWHARFEVREHPTTPPGQLHVNPPNGNRSWLLDNGELRVQVSSNAGELFRIDGNTSALSQMPLTMELKSQQEAFTLSADPPVVSIERQGRWAATVKRQDTWVDSDGLPIWNITTRLTVFRASKKIRLQQSVDLVRGTHKMEQWSLGFPANGNASVHLLLPDESLAELQGDFKVRQTAADTWRKDGVDHQGELPGVLQVGSIAFGLSQFRNLFPSGFRRENDLFYFEFCAATDRRVLALEEGFGRTRELWIEVAPPGEQVHAQEFSQAFNYPAIAHASPSQYIASGAFGSMGEALSGDHPALEQALATSVDAILARRESYSDYDIGLIGFGDDFAGRKNASYWGALQQEYDPMSVLFQQFARTGGVGFLRPAMDSAWHYADVDIAPYGGAFQHRSPVHHLETWIAHEMSAALASEATASPYWDGTVHGLLAWVDAVYEEGFRQKMEGWLEHEQRSGANADELQKRGLLMVACNEINAMLPELTINGKDMHAIATAVASHERAQQLGFSDADLQFQGFFDLFGGSWEEFPVFHVDNHPIPEERHIGSHAVIQSVVWAYFLSGENRLRDVIERFSVHHTEEVIPAAVHALVNSRDSGNNRLYTRTLAWPLINMLAVQEMFRGDQSDWEEEIKDSAQLCATTLLDTDHNRIRSTIHAGMTLEALCRFHAQNPDEDLADYLTDLAASWTATRYDWQAHAFRNELQGGESDASPGFSGLMMFGLSYVQKLEPNPTWMAALQDAWEHLPGSVSYPKTYGMRYRGAAWALANMRDLEGV